MWRNEKVRVEELAIDGATQLEPGLSAHIAAVYRLPDLGQVRNPRLVKRSWRRVPSEASTRPRNTRRRIRGEGRGDRGTATGVGVLRAGRYCVAAGAWSGAILNSVGVNLPIRPVRGQIVLVSRVPRLFSHVLQTGPRYLVPRDDGRILIGRPRSTSAF